MAKSFKQLSANKAEPAKRMSEKDIFDFIEEGRPPATSQAPVDNTRNTSNTSVPVLLGNTGVISVTNSGAAAGVTGVTQPSLGADEAEVDVRQTFIIGEHYLNRLRDYVHTRRVQGQYDYTQKQALHEALDALFAGAVIEPRPEYIRRQEDARKQKIRNGINK